MRRSGTKFYLTKAVKLLATLIIFLIFTNNIQDKYDMAFFKFGPEDLIVKIYSENKDDIIENKRESYISNIDKNSAYIFLSKEESNNEIFNNYRIVFFKPNKVENYGTINIPIYSFIIIYNNNELKVKYNIYDDVPYYISENNYEIVLKKDQKSNIYNIKNYDGEDFMFDNKIKNVEFTGKIKNKDGTFTDIHNDSNIKIKLSKYEEFLINEDVKELKNDISCEIPLNSRVYIGENRYYIDAINSQERFQIDSLIINGKKNITKIADYSEIKDKDYKQEMIFYDEGRFIDFKFESDLYSAQYAFDEMDFEKTDNSPLSLSLKKYDGKTLRMRLLLKENSRKYLNDRFENLTYLFNSNVKSIEAVKEINAAYPEISKIEPDGSIYFKPDYKQTPFLITSVPSTAEIEIKKIEPKDSLSGNNYYKVGNAPIFYDNFDYGKYSIKATWFEINPSTSKLRKYTTLKKIVFSDPTSDEFTKEMQFLNQNGTNIPYIELIKKENMYDDNAPEEIRHIPIQGVNVFRLKTDDIENNLYNVEGEDSIAYIETADGVAELEGNLDNSVIMYNSSKDNIKVYVNDSAYKTFIKNINKEEILVSSKVVLEHGNNRLSLIIFKDGVEWGRSKGIEIMSSVKSAELRFELSWDGLGDVDLHVDDGKGYNHCFYGNFLVKAHSHDYELDVDNTFGYGPENIRIYSLPIDGVIRCFVNYYSGDINQIVTVKIYQKGVLLDTKYHDFSSFDSNCGNILNPKSWYVGEWYSSDGRSDKINSTTTTIIDNNESISE